MLWIILSGACSWRRTGTHPGSRPGQAFAGTCASRCPARCRAPRNRDISPMQTVIIVIHLMVVVTMVSLVLLQRSEGGGLGMGGGSGFMTNRGSSNVLTRTTATLAAVFFATSLVL